MHFVATSPVSYSKEIQKWDIKLKAFQKKKIGNTANKY